MIDKKIVAKVLSGKSSAFLMQEIIRCYEHNNQLLVSSKIYPAYKKLFGIFNKSKK